MKGTHASDFCEEWRAIGAKERECIEAEDWLQLELWQRRKAELQNTFVDRGAPSAVLVELIAQEKANLQLLAAKKEELSALRTESQRLGRRLRQLSGAYGASGRPAWESYS